MVVVTGGTGFLGAYIIKELIEKGHRVRAIRRSGDLPHYIPASILEKAEWVNADILDVISLQEAFEGATAVVHAAAMVSFHAHQRQRMYQTNIEGTANVVNMAIDAGVKKLVHISSVAALGRTEKESMVDEDKKWVESRNNTHYAISKYQAEFEVWRGMAEGLETIILNPATIIGYGDWNNGSCAIFRNIYNSFPWYSTGINGFVDVEDVARSVSEMLNSDISGKRFIVNGDNWTFQSLFNSIADNFGKKRPYREATPFLSALAWRLEKLKAMAGKKVLLTRETARIANSHTHFDNRRILEALPGFSFTPLEESIKKACALYLKNNSA